MEREEEGKRERGGGGRGEGERLIDSYTVIVEDFNTSCTSSDRCSRQEIKKKMVALNDTIDQIDLTDIFTAFHYKAAEYTFFFNCT